MGRFIQTLSFLNIIFVIYFAEGQISFDDGKERNHQEYVLNALFTKRLHLLKGSDQLKEQHMNLEMNKVFENIAPPQFENLLLNSSKCFRDLLYIEENLQNFSNQWAIKMLDSYGKPESSILEGNLNWLGDYKECTQIYAPVNSNATAGDFHGKYCSMKWPVAISNTSVTVMYGFCIPDSCSFPQSPINVTNNLIPLNISENNSTLPQVSVECKPTERHLNTAAKVVIALLSLFCALVVISSSVTAAKSFMNRLKESPVNTSLSEIGKDENKSVDNLLIHKEAPQGLLKKLEPFLDSFCAFKNGSKLLNTDAREGELLCIHGIRFLSMSWVILGHTYSFSFSQIRNPLQAAQLVDNFAFQVIINGGHSVDSFFVLSGLLMTYLSMKEFFKTNGKISWVYFYVHRYVRLTPVYMIVLGFHATVYLYLGNGPFWSNTDLDLNCRDFWWWNLLYINNFNKITELCMGWTWYLANDMQFFVISPLFLITLWRWPKIGYSLLGIFLCSCWLSSFLITYHFDLISGVSTFLNAPANERMKELLRYNEYFEKMYIKPHTRIAPYLIGMLVGYILFMRKRNNKPKHDLVTVCVGWFLASVVALACVYGTYHQNPGVVGRSFSNAFTRTSFALGLCWVIYICLMDQGGVVNSILSYKLFIPLSRLTYSAYLIHPMMIQGYYANLKATFEFSHPTLVLLFLGFTVVTYGFALLVSLVFESPIMSLEKIVRNAFRKQQDNKSTNL